jgi:DNA repair exonuclease SbcCD nuclease subunit
LHPLVVMADLHCHKWNAFSSEDANGINSRLKEILHEIRRAAEHCNAIGGYKVFFAGDIFHVRGSIPPSVVNALEECLEQCVREFDVEFIVMPGNHDLEMNDSLTMGSAVRTLNSINGVTVVNVAKTFQEEKVLMLPWRDSLTELRIDIVNYVNGLEAASAKLKEWTLMIHAPLNGVIKGIPDNGFSGAELDSAGFGQVLVGHYHNHRNIPGTRVWSIGAPTHQTWSDVDTVTGFIALDKDRVVSHVKSSAPRFVYFDADWSDSEALEYCAGNYVKADLGSADAADIADVKQAIIDKYQAKICVVNAIPKSKEASRRGGSSANTKSTQESIQSYIESKEWESDKDEVLSRASRIMKQVEGEVS